MEDVGCLMFCVMVYSRGAGYYFYESGTVCWDGYEATAVREEIATLCGNPDGQMIL